MPKKKIKDLTQEECENICRKYDWCWNCPLVETKKCVNYDEGRLEVELEIEDNKKGNENEK